MEKALFKTDNYLLVVDDSDLKNREYCIDGYGNLLPFPDLSVLGLGYDKETIKKITFHLPLGNSPILEGVPLLPPLDVEDDVEKMAKEHQQGGYEWQNEKRKSFIAGYNKAREKYKFTEEDMKQVALESWGVASQPMERKIENLMSIIETNTQSLSQPKTPTHFEFEMESISKIVNDNWQDYESIKTTTNSQGQQVACGKYIY